MIRKEVKLKIINIVGEEHFLDSDLDCFTYSYDSSFLPVVPAHKPEAVVRPANTEEISKVMAIAFEYSIPVTARGTGTGKSGGCVPLKGGIVLSLERMNKIVEFDEGNMMVTVEPGVRTIDFYDYCAAKGLFYPPDPASWKISTIGGNVAENAGGMRAVKYGVTGNYVMGLEVVLSDGMILNTGGKAIKNVTGYNLTSLFVGSEGTLGIITKALFKLIPMPKHRGSLQIMFKSLEDGCATVHQLLQNNIVPVAAEIMDRVSLDAIAQKRSNSFDKEIGSCVVIEVDGEDQEAINAQIKYIDAVANEHGALSLRIAQNEAESQELWSIRRELSQAMGVLAPNRLSEDISVPRNSFPEIVRKIQELAKKYDLLTAVYGHAGDGNLHPTILCDFSNKDQMERAERMVDDWFAATLALGGSLTGEHGVGIVKKPYILGALGESGITAHKIIKQALDPKGILNPGKIW